MAEVANHAWHPAISGYPSFSQRLRLARNQTLISPVFAGYRISGHSRDLNDDGRGMGGMMPQVAARINENQERWLKEYFRTKSAGAEFIIPWAVDVFFRAIPGFKKIFSASELKTIVDAFRDAKLTPETTRLSYLTLRIAEACDLHSVHLRHGASKTSLQTKLNSLDEPQATALMIWASAFWVSRSLSIENLDDYVSDK